MAGVEPSHVAQVIVVVRDQERAKTFYRDKLGLRHLFDSEPQLSFFQCGGTRLMLALPEGPETAGISIIYYGVQDIHEAHRVMSGLGVEFEKAPHIVATVGGTDFWIAACRDPDGNIVGLMSETEAA